MKDTFSTKKFMIFSSTREVANQICTALCLKLRTTWKGKY